MMPFEKNGKVKLVVVMVISPLVLDAFYFWMTDSILKLNPEKQYNEISSAKDSSRQNIEEKKIEISDLDMTQEPEKTNCKSSERGTNSISNIAELSPVSNKTDIEVPKQPK